TSASSPPGTPGSKKTPAAPPLGSPRKPGAGDARRSPRSPPPGRPNPGHLTGSSTRHPAHLSHQDRTPAAAARPRTARTHKKQPGTHTSHTTRQQTIVTPLRSTPNVRPKRENRPHRNVKSSQWSGAGSNRRPSAFQAGGPFSYKTNRSILPNARAHRVREYHPFACRTAASPGQWPERGLLDGVRRAARDCDVSSCQSGYEVDRRRDDHDT